MRIVSLVPSLSQTVIDLGGADLLVGRTKFCPRPGGQHRARIIGGTKDVRVGEVLALKPDLVLAVKEENVREQVLQLQDKLPVAVYDIGTVADVPPMIEDLAYRCSLSPEPILGDLAAAMSTFPAPEGPRVAYMIWRDPWMSIGRDTYLHDMIVRAGALNIMADRVRYPVTTAEELRSRNVDEVWLSSEPYPFRPDKAALYRGELGLPIQFVDGRLLSWYGSLTAQGLHYGRSLTSRHD